MVTKCPAESPISLMQYEYDDTTIFFPKQQHRCFFCIITVFAIGSFILDRSYMQIDP